jgi:catalase
MLFLMSNAHRNTLTTEAGKPVSNNQHSQTAGPDGPVLLQDHHLIEKLARFNRERIPERIVHAVGSGAFGTFEVTADATRWTKMRLFAEVGKKTEVFARFSTVAGSKGAPDATRDPRGFAVKFYTEDGNWDLVGNNTPVFFIRDGIKFPDFIHSQKYDPHSNRQEPNNVWDFFSHSPEATHQFTWLFGDRGLPKTLRNMNGYGGHTFQWINEAGERFWVKFHFKTDQGIENLLPEEAAALAGADPQALQKDLYEAIERGAHPSWTLKVQVMPEAEAANYRFNPYDLTKVWPHEDYPMIEVGRMTLNRTPTNYFQDVEQSAFDPAHMVPGIAPSPDKMLQARLFAYGDAHRYRLGINHTHLPVNRPRAVLGGASNYGRDGAMRFDGNGAEARNYEPNSFGGPAQTDAAHDEGYALSDQSGPSAWTRHPDDDDFVQAGALYRLMAAEEQQRLVDNIAGSLGQVTHDTIIQRSLAHFHAADPEYGERIAAAIGKIKSARGGAS